MGVAVGDAGAVALLLCAVDGVRDADVLGTGRVADEDGAWLVGRVGIGVEVGLGLDDGVRDDGVAECVAGGAPPDVLASVDVGRTTK